MQIISRKAKESLNFALRRQFVKWAHRFPEDMGKLTNNKTVEM